MVFQSICGNALICDTFAISRMVCFEKGQKIKCVSLDGTIIHKSGMITGGIAKRTGNSLGRVWDASERDKLIKLQRQLQDQASQISYSIQLLDPLERLENEIASLSSKELCYREELDSCSVKLKDVEKELEKLHELQMVPLEASLNDVNSNIQTLMDKIGTVDKSIYEIQSAIFKPLLEQLNLSSMNDLEGTADEEFMEKQSRLVNQLSRLENELAFANTQHEQILERKTKLSTSMNDDMNHVKDVTSQMDKLELDIAKIRKELEHSKNQLEEGKKNVEEWKAQVALKKAKVVETSKIGEGMLKDLELKVVYF